MIEEPEYNFDVTIQPNDGKELESLTVEGEVIDPTDDLKKVQFEFYAKYEFHSAYELGGSSTDSTGPVGVSRTAFSIDPVVRIDSFILRHFIRSLEACDETVKALPFVDELVVPDDQKVIRDQDFEFE